VAKPSFVRKGFEAISQSSSSCSGQARILEVYVNVGNSGHGIYGLRRLPGLLQEAAKEPDSGGGGAAGGHTSESAALDAPASAAQHRPPGAYVRRCAIQPAPLHRTLPDGPYEEEY